MINTLYNSLTLEFSTKSKAVVRRQSKEGQNIFRRRLLMLASILTTMFVILTMTRGFALSQNYGRAIPAKMEEYVVQPGDTLWAIARKSQSNQNIYRVLDNIEQYNHMNDNENIYPGEKLWIPTK